MWSTFLAFVRKETYHILRDRRTLAILFGLPVALILIFGYTVTNEFKNASIAVMNNAQDALSDELVRHLIASGHFNLVALPHHYGELEQAFQAGEIKLAVVIPREFEQQFYRNEKVQIQLIADASEPNYATTLTAYATQMIQQFQQAHVGQATAPYRIGIQTRMVYNPQLSSAYNFIPGLFAFVLLLISALMTSLTLAKEKETGTMDLLLVSPLPPLIIIIGKVTPYVVLSFINALIILAMGYFIFKVPVLGSLSLLLLLCLLYSVTALALGILISTRVDTQQTAMMTSLFSLMMPTMLLSGFLFPIESMPLLLQYISAIVPATYFIEILKSIMLKGTGWYFILQPTLVLVVMTAVLLLAAWKNFKVVTK